MNETKEKFKAIFIPFTKVVFGVAIFHALIQWLFVIKIPLIKADVSTMYLLFPAISALVSIRLFLRKPINILMPGKQGKRHSFYEFLAFIAIFVPAGFIQPLVVNWSFPLTKVHVADDINANEPSKYYQINKLTLKRDEAMYKLRVFYSGKYQKTLNFSIFFATPVTANGQSHLRQVWVGTKYTTQIHSKTRPTDRDSTFEQFKQDCWANFNALDVSTAQYFINIPYDSDRDYFVEAISPGKPVKKSDYPIILKPVFTPFDQRSDFPLLGLAISLLIGHLLFLTVIIRPLNNANLAKLRNGTLLPDNEKIFEPIIPRKPHLVTSLTINACIIYFLYELCIGLSLAAPSGFYIGIVDAPNLHNIYSGELWKIPLSLVIHATIIHLAASLTILGMCGFLLERQLKRRYMLVCFLVIGTFSTLIALLVNPSIRVCGANGAAFGFCGIMLSFIIRGIMQPKEIGYYLLVATVAILTLIVCSLHQHASNVANLTGFVIGVVVGMFLPPKKPRINVAQSKA